MRSSAKTGLVLAAAGSGQRFGGSEPKQFLALRGTPVYLLSLRPFLQVVSQVVVVVPERYLRQVSEELARIRSQLKLSCVAGGPTRQASVAREVAALDPEMDYVLVHDAARPFATESLISRVLECTRATGSCIPILRIGDTVKYVEGEIVSKTLQRESLGLAQTPQGFTLGLLHSAIQKAAADGFEGSDEAALVEHLGEKVHLVEGDPGNVKLTWQQDLDDLAQGEYYHVQKGLPAEMKIRVGNGFDFHPFDAGRKLILGGVEIPSKLGLAGHSDADVLLHSVTDALLGAAGLDDIGCCFPDSDPQYRGISSLILLEKAHQLVRERGYTVGNVDIVVIAEQPRLRPFESKIKLNLARVLHLDESEIGLKATTMEKRGCIGRKEGIAAQAVALLFRSHDSVKERFNSDD